MKILKKKKCGNTHAHNRKNLLLRNKNNYYYEKTEEGQAIPMV